MAKKFAYLTAQMKTEKRISRQLEGAYDVNQSQAQIVNANNSNNSSVETVVTLTHKVGGHISRPQRSSNNINNNNNSFKQQIHTCYQHQAKSLDNSHPPPPTSSSSSTATSAMSALSLTTSTTPSASSGTAAAAASQPQLRSSFKKASPTSRSLSGHRAPQMQHQASTTSTGSGSIDLNGGGVGTGSFEHFGSSSEGILSFPIDESSMYQHSHPHHQHFAQQQQQPHQKAAISHLNAVEDTTDHRGSPEMRSHRRTHSAAATSSKKTKVSRIQSLEKQQQLSPHHDDGIKNNHQPSPQRRVVAPPSTTASGSPNAFFMPDMADMRVPPASSASVSPGGGGSVTPIPPPSKMPLQYSGRTAVAPASTVPAAGFMPDLAASGATTIVASGGNTYTVNEVIRKRHYRTGLNIFNKKPERGIAYLIQRGFLEHSPAAVARFLITRKGLSKQMIGEYLGNITYKFNMAVLNCFAQEMDFTGLHIDTALRKFQTYFRMPGEAQKIERLVEVFSGRYCQCNRDVIAKLHSSDTIFILAFAIILLNTDLHTPSIKAEKRMKLEDFIRNLRNIDDGHDLDPEMLAGIYERIRNQEFRPGSDHVTQVMKVQQTIVAKCPNLAVPHRRLVCYCRLYEVTDRHKKERPGEIRFKV